MKKQPAAGEQLFVERDSLELKQLQAFFAKESPSCEVVLAGDIQQAAVLATRRRGNADVLLILGGLADGRARDLLERLAAQRPFAAVVFSDRRHCRGALDEPVLEEAQRRVKPSLAGGWLLVRFLEPRSSQPQTTSP